MGNKSEYHSSRIKVYTGTAFVYLTINMDGDNLKILDLYVANTHDITRLNADLSFIGSVLIGGHVESAYTKNNIDLAQKEAKWALDYILNKNIELPSSFDVENLGPLSDVWLG